MIQQEKKNTIIASLVLLGLTILFSYPVIFHLSTHIIAGQGDAWQFPWNIFHFRENVLHGQNPYYSDFIFNPIGTPLLLHNYTEFHGILGIFLHPFFNDIALNNLFVLLSTFLSGLGMYFLARELRLNFAASLFAGIAFAFCPVRMFWITGQTHMALTEWVPFTLLFFLKTAKTGKLRSALLMGLFFSLATYCNYYFAVYLGIILILMLVYGVCAFPDWRNRKLIFNLAASGVFVLVLLSPLLLSFIQEYRERTVHSYGIAIDFATQKSARLSQYFRIGSMNPLLRKVFEQRWHFFASSILTPGWSILIPGIIGTLFALKRRNWIILIFFPVALISFLLSLGPSIDLNFLNHTFKVPLPFQVIAQMPYLNHLRFPWRFAVLVTLSLSLLGAYLISVIGELHKSRIASALVAVIFAVLLIELSPIPLPMEILDSPEAFKRLGKSESNVMMTLPYYPSVGWASHYMCYQMFHKQKLLDGRISRPPQPQVNYFRSIPIAETLRQISSFNLHVTEQRILQDKQIATLFTGFFQVRHISLFPPYSSRPDVLEYISQVFPEARLISEDKSIRIYELRPPEIRSYRLVADDPGMRFFLLANWEYEHSHQQRKMTSRQQEASLLFPKVANSQIYSLALRMKSNAEQKLLVKVGAFQQELDLSKNYRIVSVDIPAKAIKESHGVVKLSVASSTRQSPSDPYFELRALELSIR